MRSDLTSFRNPAVVYVAQGSVVFSCYSQQAMGWASGQFAAPLALGRTQSPIQWVPGALSLGLKRPGYESGQLLPSSVRVE